MRELLRLRIALALDRTRYKNQVHAVLHQEEIAVKFESTDRTERLLALLLVHTMKGTQAEKAVELSAAGFTNIEISNLLQTTQGVIAQYRYTARKSKKRDAK